MQNSGATTVTISLYVILGTLSSVLCAVLTGVNQQMSTTSNVVKVTVFYESRCPDSMNFFSQQLDPTFHRVGGYMNIDLVPYGKAKVVKLTVFYESQCPFCMMFFTKQLGPTFGQLGQYMEVEPVPYGNAKQSFTNGSYTFSCQHGPDECRYNKIHSCAIKYMPNKNKLIQFISCLMKDREEDNVILQCAEADSQVDLATITTCANSQEGDELLAAYGNRTHNFQPKIRGVPTIVFNDVYNDADEELAETCLFSAICKKLDPKPDECHPKVSVV